MHSYNHLWEKFISDENIDLAIKNALKGKRRRNRVMKQLENPNFHDNIKAYAQNFHNAPHKPKIIYDGVQRKKRTIIVPTFREQVIHHMVVNVLKPIFEKSFYYHSYGSIPNKGCHKGMKTIKKWIKTDLENCKYCLKMDIKKYFESIPHDVYLEKMRNLIHDKKFLSVVEEITNVCDKGIPLGFYLSQWTANWYLTELDHFVKECLHAKYYIRLMDDMVIFADNKIYLHYAKDAIETYLSAIGLELKENWQIFPLKSRPLDYMGFRFYPNRVTLRKSLLRKATRKAVKIWKMEKVTIHAYRQMLSYLGWIKATDTYRYYETYIKPYVTFQKAKRRISRYDRRMNNELVQNAI